MASVTFKRGTKAEIESTQIQDGQLLMETDQLNNNKIYLDLPNGTRVPVGGSGAWVGTKEEFELAVEEGKIADGTQVIITDDYESGITASMTLYSNAQSGLVATNVQGAIDELNSNFTNMIISARFTFPKKDAGTSGFEKIALDKDIGNKKVCISIASDNIRATNGLQIFPIYNTNDYIWLNYYAPQNMVEQIEFVGYFI